MSVLVYPIFVPCGFTKVDYQLLGMLIGRYNQARSHLREVVGYFT